MSRKMIIGLAVGFAVVLAASAALRGNRPADRKDVHVVQAEHEEPENNSTKVRKFTGSASVQAAPTPPPVRRERRERSTTGTRSLSGKVSLINGTPLANAVVTVNFNTSTTTNADGHYEFS